jgi:hypothetical protein
MQLGTYKVRNETETKRNEINENETKRNQQKRNETKRNEINEMKTKLEAPRSLYSSPGYNNNISQ